MHLLNKLKLHFLIGLILISPLFVSCGSDSNNKTSSLKEGSIESTPFLLLSESGLLLADSTLQGSGVAVAKNPLGDIQADKNIALTFVLEPRGSLSVIAFGSNSNAGGVMLTFTRQEEVLLAKLEAAGKIVDISKNFVALDASSDISLLIDVHNGEIPAHILAWKGDTIMPDDTNALFNSEKAADGESPGNGTGTFWGLTLSKAIVKKASATEAKFEHE
jgi:hypothetical protein